MAARRIALKIAFCLTALVQPIGHTVYAADLISSSPGRASSYGNSYARYSVEECADLMITDDSGRRVVRLCNPPLNLDPRGPFEPGSSAGTSITISSSFNVEN